GTITTPASGAFTFSGMSASKTYFLSRANAAGNASTQAIAGSGTASTATKITNDQIKVVLGPIPTFSANDRFLEHVANRAPVAVDDNAITNEDTALAIDAAFNDTDVDGTSPTVKAGSISVPAHGTATLITSGPDAGKILYTPAANYNGPDSFTYKATDGSLDSNTATVDRKSVV